MNTDRIIAHDRAEDDYCDKSTQGCCIDHAAERARDPKIRETSCETW